MTGATASNMSNNELVAQYVQSPIVFAIGKRSIHSFDPWLANDDRATQLLPLPVRIEF